MRDAQYPLRLSIYNKVTNQVTYNGSPVGFYDERKRAAGDVYCVFGTQTSTPTEANDCTWMTEELIDIEIWQRQGFEVTKDFVDDISNQLYQLLNPAVLTAGFANPMNMQVVSFDLQQAITRSVEITPTETVIAKILTFKAVIVQQS